MKDDIYVSIGIYKPLKVDYVEDELVGKIEGKGKIRYTGRKVMFYKDGVAINCNQFNEYATWKINTIRKRKKKLGNCHDSFLKQVYIMNELYRDYHCWHHKITEPYEKNNDYFNELVNPKFTKVKVIPLQVILTKNFLFHTWVKGYFHHPIKSIVTTNTEEMVNYFRKYYGIDGNYKYKENLINRLVKAKEKADYEVKEGGLVILGWNWSDDD